MLREYKYQQSLHEAKETEETTNEWQEREGFQKPEGQNRDKLETSKHFHELVGIIYKYCKAGHFSDSSHIFLNVQIFVICPIYKCTFLSKGFQKMIFLCNNRPPKSP